MTLANFIDLFVRDPLRSLARHRMRSGLTALGIAVGVVTVVYVITAVGESKKRIDAEFAELGDNLVWVEAGSRNVRGLRTGSHGTTSLTLEDAEAIRAVPGIARISPQVDGSIQIGSAHQNWYTRFRGESEDYVAIKRWSIASGEMFTADDVEHAARKVLLGQTVAEQLFGTESPVGRAVTMNRHSFEVVGVLASKGQSGAGQNQDDWVLLPFTAAERSLRGGGFTWLDDVLCSADSAEDVGAAAESITALLRERHGIAPGDEDDFNIRHPEEAINAKRASDATLAALLIGVAGLSLLLAGVGVMNVMLATVLQRTREIGLRLAVGATPAIVQLQFVSEAVALATLGGAAGIGASYAAAACSEALGHGRPEIPLVALAVALGSSSATGLFFGIYPARRAAGLDPVEALRSEP